MKERRGMATYRMEGNNVVTSYNPTEQEQNAYNYVQGQLPNIYKNAIQQFKLFDRQNK